MKKIFFLASIAATLLGICLTACNDVIFAEIRNEVELEDAQISGIINAIVRYSMDTEVTNENGTTTTEEHEFLVVCNNKIWCKDVTENPTTTSPYSGKWQQIPLTGISGSGLSVIKLAADSTTLYALIVTVEKNSDTGYNERTTKKLYAYSASDKTWTEVALTDAEGTAVALGTESVTMLFCTNAPQKAHRAAYLRNATVAVYELSGGNATLCDTGDTNLATTPTTSSTSCAYFADAVYFSNGSAIATNESAEQTATTIYYSSGTDLYYASDPAATSAWTKALDTNTINAIACTNDYILLGTSSGLIYATVETNDSGIAVPTAIKTVTNASSTLSSYYQVRAVVSVNPALDALNSDIYGTTVFSGSSTSTGASSDNVGLWAYYPGRGNWNRE